VLNNTSILKIIPVLKFELYTKESSFLIKTINIKNILIMFKNHFSYQFKVLTCITGIDYPKNLYRFQIVYELLSLKYNFRIKLKILVDESTPLKTIEQVYSSATWYEAEIWDMFGVFFIDHSNSTRLLTDYGFQGYPLRKDFPLTGFVEARFNFPKSQVGYVPIELTQEFRTFFFASPWGNQFS
jgi:NADH-quinone oxidoreductase subunit C